MVRSFMGMMGWAIRTQLPLARACTWRHTCARATLITSSRSVFSSRVHLFMAAGHHARGLNARGSRSSGTPTSLAGGILAASLAATAVLAALSQSSAAQCAGNDAPSTVGGERVVSATDTGSVRHRTATEVTLDRLYHGVEQQCGLASGANLPEAEEDAIDDSGGSSVYGEVTFGVVSMVCVRVVSCLLGIRSFPARPGCKS